MAIATAKAQCSLCQKETRTFICQGCSQNFCLIDLNKHIQSLSEQLDHIETDHNQFRQKLLDQKINAKNHSSIQQVDQWEKNSIHIIKQIAEQCRQKLINYFDKFHNKLENQLNNLAKQIKDVREENEFNEIDLEKFKQKLNDLTNELNKPSNVSIKQNSTSFINKISVNVPFNKDTKWKQNGITIVGSNGKGNQLNQVRHPRGIFIDDGQTLYIADWTNHRILEWKPNATNGRIVAGGNGEGNQMNQLNQPTDVIIDKQDNFLIIADRRNRQVMQWSRRNNITNGQIIVSDIDCFGLAMDKDGSLYVCDDMKNEVRRWTGGETNGTIVAGGNGKGDQLNQLDVPTYIFVDADYSLYISDNNNHRVMKWLKDAKEGIVVAGGNDQGNNLTQLSFPHGVTVDQYGQIYVADWDNHRVMRWCEGANEGTIVVGGKEEGKESNQFSNPQGLSFDREGNLYVTDCNNSRIQKFEVDLNEDILFESVKFYTRISFICFFFYAILIVFFKK